MNRLEVYLPYSKALITQRFGANANSLYAQNFLKGHTAYDWGAQYGTEIPNCVENAYCYSVMNKDSENLSKYRAVFMLVETESGVYEISYGHCSDIYAQVGSTYNVGDIIGRVGNTGACFVGQHEVTEDEKKLGSHAGAHLHGPQIRPVVKVTTLKQHAQYLKDEKGFLKIKGFYFEIPDYENGYNGCISLAPFSTETLAVKQSTPPKPPLSAQTSGTITPVLNAINQLPVAQRVSWLQKLLDILLGAKK